MTDANQGVTRYDYDDRGNLVKVTDPRGLVTQYQYSGFNDLLAQTSPDTGASSASYNAAGQLVGQTDAKGQLTQYTYDTAGRIKTVTYADQSSAGYRYNGPNLAGIDDASGTFNLGYDDFGRLNYLGRKVGVNTYGISYTRDAKGRIATLRYPSGRTLTYSYSAIGQLNQIVSKLGTNPSQTLLSNIAYRAFGPAQSWTYGNGLARSSSFDQEGHLTGYSLGDSTVTLGYDNAGRLTSQSITGGWWQRLLQSLGLPAGQQDQYGYDDLNRLTSWQGQAANQNYDYDADGNRLLLKRDGNAYPQYVSNASNQIVSVDGPQAQSYSYDANGSRSADARTSYVYDARGRLVQAGGAIYTLSTQGQRTGKRYQGQTTLYHYDADGHLIAETDDQGHTQREYVYLADTPVAVFDAAGTVRYIHADHLGTPRLVTDAAQHAVWAWQGEPFGGDAANEDPEGTGTQYTFNLRFPGQYYDAETGNHYNLNRDYDPKLGRYLQSDPIGLAGGINTYGYVGGNPLSYSDPMGLNPIVYGTQVILNEGLIIGAGGRSTSSSTRALDVLDGLSNAVARPQNMTKLEERHFDRTCARSNDPCAALKASAQQAISQARLKMNNMLNDTTLYRNAFSIANPAVTGTNTTWLGHVDDLDGRIANVWAMIHLGRKLGCDMSAETAAAASLLTPSKPTNP